MSKVTVMGTFKCQDGKAEEMEAVLAAMVEAASGEPGVEIYSYHRGEENSFWFFALILIFNSLFGDMGLIQTLRQRKSLDRLGREVADLRAENERLTAEIQDLHHDPYRIETIAREELGLARPGEILFLFQEPTAAAAPPPASAPSPPRAPAPRARRVP